MAIRFVQPGAADADGILAIYGPFIRETAVTFEYEVPETVDFARRIGSIMAKYPYLVHEEGGKILAYAYASLHMERAAFAWDVQTSVYAAPEARATGVARALYSGLFAMLAALGYCNAYAVITLPNPRSVRFHESFGFAQAGVHYKAGYKAGSWHDVGWMQKKLAEYPLEPEPPRPVSALDPALCERIFAAKATL